MGYFQCKLLNILAFKCDNHDDLQHHSNIYQYQE